MVKLLQGDCRDVLKTLADKSVNCCVTSPPYFGLRDYGVDGQIGLEQTPDAYVAELVAVFREVKRVLRDDGTLWLNLGDSYAGSGKGPAGNLKYNENGHVENSSGKLYGLKHKDLIGIPWRVAFALQADGWYLRQDIIWHKPNPMPESVTDRCTKAHEYIFLLSKSARYYYDSEAIKEPITDTSAIRLMQDIESQKGSDRVPFKTNGNMKAVASKKFDSSQGGGGTSFVGHSGYYKADGSLICDGTRNKRSVWTVATQPYSGAHFATFPCELIQPCIRAGCPAGGVVLDPFGGSGTTGSVAASEGRDAIMIELNPEYVELQMDRCGLFAEIPLDTKAH